MLVNIAMSLLPATSAFGFAFLPLYRWHVDRLHAKILAKGTRDGQTALEAVRARGGTSMLAVLILLAVVFAVVVLGLSMFRISSEPGASKPAF